MMFFRVLGCCRLNFIALDGKLTAGASTKSQESSLHLSGHECFITLLITKTFSKEENMGTH
jgi:hypothetical protein